MKATQDNMKSDELTYFAYGSNMCTARLRARVPSATPVGIARLTGYDLRFHKRSSDGSAKCNIVETPNAGAQVIGVLFNFLGADKPDLDDAEGLGKGYHEEEVQVLSEGGLVPCFLYVADEHAIEDSLKPYDWYKEFVVVGAKEHGLPPDYIAQLEAVVAIPDPEPGRNASERAILTTAFSGKP